MVATSNHPGPLGQVFEANPLFEAIVKSRVKPENYTDNVKIADILVCQTQQEAAIIRDFYPQQKGIVIYNNTRPTAMPSNCRWVSADTAFMFGVIEQMEDLQVFFGNCLLMTREWEPIKVGDPNYRHATTVKMPPLLQPTYTELPMQQVLAS